MELDEFVRASIMQVIKGVHTAQRDAAAYGAVINPRHLENQEMRRETTLSFDVALTVSGTNTGEAGGKIAVASMFSLGGKATESDTRQETSRVQFDVVITLPRERERMIQITNIHNDERNPEPSNSASS